MLPVMIYEPDADTRALLVNALRALSAGAGSLFRICASTGSSSDLLRYLQAEPGISLVILGMARQPENNFAQCFQLGQLVMQQNRDSYTLFVVHNPEDLTTLIQNCMRPAGIVIPPFEHQNLDGCLKRILDDYSRLNSEEETDSGFLMLESGSASYRVPYSQLLFVEALDKKLNVCTQRQSITVRKSLGSIAGDLPEQFIRCHRSYIVNSDYIDHVSFTDMSLTLTNGENIPISRSCRDALREYLERKKVDA